MFNHLDSFLTLGNYRTLFGLWTRAVAVALSKGHPTVAPPTRRSNGDVAATFLGDPDPS